MKTIKLTALAVVGPIAGLATANAQLLTNGDLEGPFGSPDVLPTGWSQVPVTSPISNTQFFGGVGAADTTGTIGPNTTTGVAGIPQSGNSFVSGLEDLDTGHDGIMQTVSLVGGASYSLSFYQAVVKEVARGIQADNNQGGWNVYLDTTLVGSSAFSTSTLATTDINLNWELRSLNFTPAATGTYDLSFMPYDAASLLLEDPHIRMGIDTITLVPEPSSALLCGMGGLMAFIRRKR